MFAATAALGRTSSQFSASTVTSTPVFSMNFFVFASHWSSSPWTKRFQRNTRNFAPGSGWNDSSCAIDSRASIGAPSAAPAAADACKK